MPYYLRVLSPSKTVVPLNRLIAAVPEASIDLETGTATNWEQILLRHSNGTDIALVEKNVVENGSMGSEEIDEFQEEIENCKPASAAKWLAGYLKRVRVIYAFQTLNGTEQEGGWEILGKLKSALWNDVGGIFQADGEGFSNEDGYHILWQFSEKASGSWWMGVLLNKEWVHFEMYLGDTKQCAAFFEGKVPDGVKRA